MISKKGYEEACKTGLLSRCQKVTKKGRKFAINLPKYVLTKIVGGVELTRLISADTGWREEDKRRIMQ